MKSKRITNEIADKVCDSLMSKKFSQLESERKKFVDLMEKGLLKVVPKEIIEASKKYPLYFKNSHVYIDWERFKMLSIPGRRSSSDSYYLMDFKESDQKKIKDAYKKYMSSKKELNQKKNELTNTLKAIRTTKNLEREWPEAYKVVEEYFPDASMALMPVGNIESLKEFIK